MNNKYDLIFGLPALEALNGTIFYGEGRANLNTVTRKIAHFFGQNELKFE